ASYAGFLFVGLMLSPRGPRVVEFNCRFGDPECQAVLPRLDQDLLPVLAAVAHGRPLPERLAWSPDASACVVLASGGYPGRYPTGIPIEGLDGQGSLPDANVFHAGTAVREGRLGPARGRVPRQQAR